MIRYIFKFLCLIKNILKHKKGVASIEMAFIIPIFIAFIMAVFEYATVFSMKIGIHNRLEDITRLVSKPTPDFSVRYGVTHPDKNMAATLALYKTLKKIGVNTKNVELWYYTSTWGSYDIGDALKPLCSFTDIPPATPCEFSNAGIAFLTHVQLRYKYTFLTPVGKIISGSSFSNEINLVFNTHYTLQ